MHYLAAAQHVWSSGSGLLFWCAWLRVRFSGAVQCSAVQQASAAQRSAALRWSSAARRSARCAARRACCSLLMCPPVSVSWWRAPALLLFCEGVGSLRLLCLKCSNACAVMLCLGVGLARAWSASSMDRPLEGAVGCALGLWEFGMPVGRSGAPVGLGLSMRRANLFKEKMSRTIRSCSPPPPPPGSETMASTESSASSRSSSGCTVLHILLKSAAHPAQNCGAGPQDPPSRCPRARPVPGAGPGHVA